MLNDAEKRLQHAVTARGGKALSKIMSALESARTLGFGEDHPFVRLAKQKKVSLLSVSAAVEGHDISNLIPDIGAIARAVEIAEEVGVAVDHPSMIFAYRRMNVIEINKVLKHVEATIAKLDTALIREAIEKAAFAGCDKNHKVIVFAE